MNASIESMPHKNRDIVKVGPAYSGNGQYRNDGGEGIYTVVGYIPSIRDYYLVKGVVPDATKGMWDLMVHETRITKLQGAAK